MTPPKAEFSLFDRHDQEITNLEGWVVFAFIKREANDDGAADQPIPKLVSPNPDGRKVAPPQDGKFIFENLKVKPQSEAPQGDYQLVFQARVRAPLNLTIHRSFYTFVCRSLLDAWMHMAYRSI